MNDNNPTNNPEELAYDVFDVNEPDSTDNGGYDLFNVEPDRDSNDRLQRLEKAKNKALNRLNPETSLDDSFTDMGNGWLESNSNKIWNDLSDQGVQSLYKEVLGKTLTREENGRTFFNDGTEYKGSTRRAYLGSTKDDANNVIKFGLARGDKDSSAPRYDPSQGGWVSGEKGIDTSKFESDVLLPYGVATMMEAVLHGRKKALEGRVVKDMFANPDAKAAYGGGASEYYNNMDALFGKATDTDSELGAKLFNEFMEKLPHSHKEYRGGKGGLGYLLGDYDDMDMGSKSMNATRESVNKYLDEKGVTAGSVLKRAGNTLGGFGATFVNELLVKPADAVGDLTGLYDLDMDGDTTKAVEDAFGYDSRAVEEAIQKVGNYWDIASNSEAATSERVRAAGNGMLEAFTTPEMLGTSLGALLSWVTPGALLKAAGVGSKYAKTAAKVDSLVDAGKLTPFAGKVKKAQEFMSIDGAKAFLTSQSGFIASSLGNVNKQYEEFVAHNNGVELEGAEKAKWFAGRFAVQIVNQNLDKLVDLNVIKSPGVVKALVPAVKAMTEKEFGNVAKTLSKGMASTLAASGSEAAQEYAQTSMELFNSRYGAEQFKDLDTFTKFLSNSDNIREAGIGALAGAGGSAQFEMLGAAGSSLGALPSKFSGDTGEFVPESQSVVKDIKNVSAAHKSFASDNEADNPAAAFYAAQASNDSDTKVKAGEYAANSRSKVLDGSHTIFHSDKPTSLKDLSRMVEIDAAANPEEDYTPLKAAIERSMAKKGETLTPEMSTELDNARKAGQAFSRVKTMAEVSGEVSTGVGGFVTYYSAAKAAEHMGDTKAQAENTQKLESFYHYEANKAARIKSKLEEVEGLVIAEAEALVRSGKAPNINEALRIKGKEYGKHSSKRKGKTTTVKNSDKQGAKTTEIPHYDVALKLRSQDSQTPFEGGIYNLLSTVNNEVSGMKEVYSLLGGVADNQTKDVATVTDNAVPEVSSETVPKRSTSTPTTNPTPSFTVDDLEAAQQDVKDLNAAIAKSEDYSNSNFVNDSVLDDNDLASMLASAQGQFEGSSGFDDDASYSFTREPLTEDEVFDSTFEDGSKVDSVIEKDVPANTSFSFTRKPRRKKEEKVASVRVFQDTKNAINAKNKEIQEYKDHLRNIGVITDELEIPDEHLDELMADKKALMVSLVTFENKTKSHVDARTEALSSPNGKFKLFSNYDNGVRSDEKYSIKDVFKTIIPTGFTVENQTYEDLQPETKAYSDRLTEVVPKEASNYFNGIANSLAGFLLYDENGDVNYNTVQAMHAATGDYILRNAENLFGAYRSTEDIAEILGIDETEVTMGDIDMLMFGGVTLRLASADVGKAVVRALGIRSSSIAAQNALETHLGIAALQGYADKEGQGVQNKVLSRARKGQNTVDINIISGTDKLLENLSTISGTNKSIEEKLQVKIDSSRAYRKTKRSKPRKVSQHNAEYLDAPKDHTTTVNKMENTAFKFNSGNAVLLDIFNDNGVLDKEALMDKIIGDKDKKRNKDDKDSYDAQRAALKRSLDSYTDAHEDVGDAELFFDWFVAKNHRMHLDSTGINPQGDKHIARWLITATKSSVDINKDLLDLVVNGKRQDNTDDDVMTAKTFAYAIVQAFDGVDGIPGIDKDPEAEILAKAKELLDPEKYSIDDMYEMAKSDGLAHVGHAALAIANIQKLRAKNSSATFNSDMVLEIDGLTNGFAFRAMQFPVGSEMYDVKEWLEKVGVIEVDDSNKGSKNGKPLSELKSMNSAREAGLEDVYISTGKVLGSNVKVTKEGMESKSKKSEEKIKEDQQSLKWISLFEKHGKLPDFTANMEDGSDKAKDLLKFVRNLMKSPVMIFGYAAGAGKIVRGLVNDQILGRGYLKGKGLVQYLTAVNPETNDYFITEDDLIELFPEDGKGADYHKARVALDSESLASNTHTDIVTLRTDLEKAISSLYGEPLSKTLTELFSEQTEVNAALIQAGEFLFKHFEKYYNEHIARNPGISEAGKMEWLKNYGDVIPGIAGASTTDQKTKLAFLKSILDKTNNYVIANMDGKKLSTNTVSRGFGDPGVLPAVLTILSLDSSTLSISINEFYRDKDYAAVVPVHDAEVLGVGDYGLAKQYNKDIYLVNKRYSVAEEFMRAIDALEAKIGDEVNTLRIEGPKKPVNFAEMKSRLTNVVRRVQEGRKELYSKKLNIGQMVLSDDTMYIADPEKGKDDAISYIKDLSSRIDKLMESSSVKDALGKEKYRTHKKRLKSMLKGCK